VYKSFKDMQVWQRAVWLSGEVFRNSSVLPEAEDYGLTLQLRRAENNVSGNIAEAFGRKTKSIKAILLDLTRISIRNTKPPAVWTKSRIF